MPPKRRAEKPRSAALTAKDPPKQPPSARPVPVSAPILPPPQPPPPPPETGAAKVRKEWSKFVDAWYEPQKRKLVEKLQKDILVKYKSLGSAKETQKLREMELFEKLDSIAEQLTQPARVEWERRLALAHLREDQWDDMTGEEQQAVLSVFVGFFTNDVEDMEDDDLSSSIEEDIAEEPPYRGMPSYAPPALSRQPIPPTPTRQTFEFVNPTSFFVDSMTPPNPTKNLPALSMDHLATLGPSNAARSAELVSASVSGMPGFHNWASEVGIVSQQPQPQPAKPPATSTPSAQSLSARPRATDNMSRQPSAASTSYSPPLKSSSPQYSPQNQTTKFSPPINAEYLPPGKRYIGPVILEEEPDPIEEVLLKSKMADEYQQYKISLRIQMIYQFHAEAADVEIKLFESLLAGEGTKESRARAVQEHETSMMRLREQKEEERKRLCAEEREKRREEIRHHLAQRRSTQNREVDSGPKADPSKSFPDKTSLQQRPGKATHQKENVPLSRPAVASSSKLEAPSVIKKSNSSLSQDEASANEVLFANAMAMMTQGKAGAGILTSAQASLNEALFANAAAALSAHPQPGTTGKSTVQPPSIMKKSNSSRSQEYDVPQITVSFADPPTSATPEPAQAPPATAKGKKGKKGQPTAQIPPARSVAITEEPEVEMGAELPLSPSLWGAATVTAKSVLGVPSTSLSTSTAKLTTSMEEERDPEPPPATASAPANAKKPTPSSKKGKKVTIIEEPDVDADPIVSPPKTKAVKGAWGSVSGKSKVTPPVAKESEPEPPPPPSVTPSRGKKAAEAVAKSSQKPQLKVTILEEDESEFEPSPAPARTSKAKPVWDVPAATTSTQAAKKTTQQQAVPRHGASSSDYKSGRVDTVPDPEDKWPEMVAGESTMPGTLESAVLEGADDDEEGDASAWFNPENMSYWAKFMAGQPEAEAETQAPPPTEQTGKHVRWTPAISEESDGEEVGEVDEELATSMWMQYAISGGDIPALGGAPEESRVMPSGIVQPDTSLWERGTGKKNLNPATGDLGNRAQQTSVFDRAALTGQWPKMDSWLSPPSRGQNSSSTRVF
ncbi:hypothetical protein L210DRAFT_3506528 [Boletus edulis BED1]|uniref:Uncharacterized protein n=1 Tax=Boletus edulis BED1 TaxID=1328754 RepID=A0AAD4GBN6_BOLED|nr:hypothetical protein L210DRAFT_3506528 [Boletus edulis BED1]